MHKNVMSAGLAAALAASAGTASGGEYLSGDFHNHTTCSDGSTSVETLTRKSLEYVDWFIHVGHSGAGLRDCRISDFLGLNRDSQFNRGLWVNSLPNGEADIKGDPVTQTVRTGDEVAAMWRWQSLQEYNLDGIVDARNLPQNEGKIAFLGLEWVVPGHEHSSNSISAGHYAENPNSDAIAQFEYCFARNSNDTSMGGGQGWSCELPAAGNNRLKQLFEGRPEEGVADYNSTLVAGINVEDQGEHVKSTAAVLWMQENFPGESFAVQAHVERAGSFVPGTDRGYNVEHLRDWHTVAPDVAFGFESQPGHQAVYNRGGYSASRPTAGLFTYGGTGCYAAAEAAKPGMDFDGTPLTLEDFAEGGAYPLVGDDVDPARVTLCRPGVRTMWDALLSEGRRYYFFASSDWHSRGSFGPLDFESTSDFWPGEYQEHFSYAPDNIEQFRDPAKAVVDSLRSGNSYAVQGQLIAGDLEFKACTRRRCATMGETLNVSKGDTVYFRLEVTDPRGKNNSPYTFNNPSLLQIGVEQPLNRPQLAQVDLIMGEVGTTFTPADPEYYNPVAPETTRIVKTYDHFGRHPRKIMEWSAKIENDSYIRARGTNIPAGTPNERDPMGNPLPDNLSDNIACDDPACPAHVEGILTADVEAWADIWFHTNPIFIEVSDLKRPGHGRPGHGRRTAGDAAK